MYNDLCCHAPPHEGTDLVDLFGCMLGILVVFLLTILRSRNTTSKSKF